MPKKSSYQKKVKILVVMEKEMRDIIIARSKINCRSMSSEIVSIIKKEITKYVSFAI